MKLLTTALITFLCIIFIGTELSSQHFEASTNTAGGVAIYGVNTAFVGTGTGVYGASSGEDGIGVLGMHLFTLGNYPGVWGASHSQSDDASGVKGEILTNMPGDNSAGVLGINRGTGFLGDGVYGYHIGSGAGVRGRAYGAEGTGVSGRADGAEGNGVYGQGDGVNATGVFGRTSGASGTGVLGWHTSSSGTAAGVEGKSFSTAALAIGVKGEITSTVPGGSSAGVRGINNGTNAAGMGVFGSHAGDGWGVYGKASGSSSYGVVGSGGSSDFWALNAGSINYGGPSSIRWKNNIRNIPKALDKIEQLRGVYYDWDEEHGGQHDVGFIAEEIGEVLPEIVAYEENGIDAIGLDYSKITPLLVESINALRREYQEQINTLNAKVARQEKEIVELKSLTQHVMALLGKNDSPKELGDE